MGTASFYGFLKSHKRFSGQPDPFPARFINLGGIKGCALRNSIIASNPTITKTNVNRVRFGRFFD
jgi:hypothetical protein